MTIAEAIREYVNETEGLSSMSRSRKRSGDPGKGR